MSPTATHEATHLSTPGMTTTALRRTRRALEALLGAASLAVIVTAGLALLGPALGGRTLVIGGGSMEPTIPRGALVIVLPSAAGYAVGDVVTVQQGTATPYTHRITRRTALGGVPYVETKGDANAAPDPAIVPAAAIAGRIALAIPALGYLSALLGTFLGLAGFLALAATALLLAGALEDLEGERCPACAAAAPSSVLPAPTPRARGVRGGAPGARAPAEDRAA